MTQIVGILKFMSRKIGHFLLFYARQFPHYLRQIYKVHYYLIWALYKRVKNSLEPTGEHMNKAHLHFVLSYVLWLCMIGCM